MKLCCNEVPQGSYQITETSVLCFKLGLCKGKTFALLCFALLMIWNARWLHLWLPRWVISLISIIILMYSLGVYLIDSECFLSSSVWLQCKNGNLKAVIRMKWIVYLQLNPALFTPLWFPSMQSQLQYAGSTSALIWTQQFIKQVFIELSFPFDHRPTASREGKLICGGGDSGEGRQLLHLALNNLDVTRAVSITSLRNCIVFGDGDEALIKTGTSYFLRFVLVGNKMSLQPR